MKGRKLFVCRFKKKTVEKYCFCVMNIYVVYSDSFYIMWRDQGMKCASLQDDITVLAWKVMTTEVHAGRYVGFFLLFFFF